MEMPLGSALDVACYRVTMVQLTHCRTAIRLNQCRYLCQCNSEVKAHHAGTFQTSQMSSDEGGCDFHIFKIIIRHVTPHLKHVSHVCDSDST